MLLGSSYDLDILGQWCKCFCGYFLTFENNKPGQCLCSKLTWKTLSDCEWLVSQNEWETVWADLKPQWSSPTKLASTQGFPFWYIWNSIHEEDNGCWKLSFPIIHQNTQITHPPSPVLVHKQIAVINLCNLCPRLLFAKLSGQANIPLEGRFESRSIQNFIGRVHSQKPDVISNRAPSSCFWNVYILEEHTGKSISMEKQTLEASHPSFSLKLLMFLWNSN